MFGSKSRKIRQLQEELETTKMELAKTNNLVASLVQEKQALISSLDAAKARLREIQDKSNARTRKCRAKKKEAK